MINTTEIGDLIMEKGKCYKCGGTGRYYVKDDCFRCKGKGYIWLPNNSAHTGFKTLIPASDVRKKN